MKNVNWVASSLNFLITSLTDEGSIDPIIAQVKLGKYERWCKRFRVS